MTIPATESKPQQQARLMQFNQLMYSSPIPPPEILAKYEELSPGLVERIVVMSEKQLQHRHDLDNKKLQADIDHINKRDFEASKGQIFGFIISFSIIALGYLAVLRGFPGIAATISAFGIGGVVTSFILGRTKDHK